MPLYPNANQTATTIYYGDSSTGQPGSLIGLRLNPSNPPALTSGAILNDELVVTHNPANDELNLDVEFKTAGQPLWLTLGLLRDNQKGGPVFNSLDPPASLSLTQFNMGAQLIVNSFGTEPGGPIVGTVTSLTSAANTPEPSTLLMAA